MKELLLDLSHAPETASRAVQNFLIRLADTIIERKHTLSALATTDEAAVVSFSVDIHFVCLGDGLTKAAWEEYSRIVEPAQVEFEGVTVYLNYFLRFANDLIVNKWRQQNSGWQNLSGQRQDKIELRCANNHTDIIQTAKSCTFYSKAGDLVRAYDDLGYQIFEPNVRCELVTSAINKEIRQSLSHARGRRNFRDLNNGVTITCSSFAKPSANRPVVSLTRPGIINGLQTVKSLHDAYYGLKDVKDREDFDENTEVLVRVHTATQADEIAQLIRATNNQNPMNPGIFDLMRRNKSGFQEFFSNLGWFYARKEREWEAFRDYHRRGRSGSRISGIPVSARGK